MQRLVERINALVGKDKQKKTFGVSEFGSGHQYQLNPVLSCDQLQHFEKEYDIRLPNDYADFITQIGNGGTGPYYGLHSLANAVSDQPGHKSRAFLASPFPLTEFFNPCDAPDYENDDFDDDQFICGSIVLSHQGCGYYDRLVITGPQAGQVWADGRVSDQGIVPLGCDFYSWYDGWITRSLNALI